MTEIGVHKSRLFLSRIFSIVLADVSAVEQMRWIGT